MSYGPRLKERKNWGTDDSQTPILHVDMDAFFVSVELLDRPDLRGKPVVVGGGTLRGVVSAASYEARQFGINSAMPLQIAMRRCAQLIVLPARMSRYRAVSEQIMQIFSTFTPLVEPISIDEAFLDVSGARKLYGSPLQIGALIRQEIHQQVGVPASVGIANTKHLAKIASANAKPDGMLLISANRAEDFLRHLPIGALWGVGEQTLKKLNSRGLFTVVDLVNLGQASLEKIIGKAAGAKLYALATNQDDRAVHPPMVEKSISKEETFYEPLQTWEECCAVLLAQSHFIAKKLRSQSLLARTIAIKVRTPDFRTKSRSVTLATPTALGKSIYEVAKDLLAQTEQWSKGLRLLGVRAENLVGAERGVQADLFTEVKEQRAQKAAQAVDAVQEKFGNNFLQLGTNMVFPPRDNR